MAVQGMSCCISAPPLCGHCGRPIIGTAAVWHGSTGYHIECTQSPYARSVTSVTVDSSKLPEWEARAELSERALRICVAYSDPKQHKLIVTSKAIQQVSAELAALEAQK
jgi:hypothetical protein